MNAKNIRLPNLSSSPNLDIFCNNFVVSIYQETLIVERTKALEKFVSNSIKTESKLDCIGVVKSVSLSLFIKNVLKGRF